MEELLKAAFEAGKDLGHSMATGKPTYGQNFNEWYASQALRIHDVVGRSEQLFCQGCHEWKDIEDVPEDYNCSDCRGDAK